MKLWNDMKCYYEMKLWNVIKTMILSIAFGVVLVAAKWKASYAVKIKETFEHQPVFLFSFREEKDPWVCEDRRAKAVVWWVNLLVGIVLKRKFCYLHDSPRWFPNSAWKQKKSGSAVVFKAFNSLQHFSSFWCVPSVKAKLKMLYMYSWSTLL